MKEKKDLLGRNYKYEAIKIDETYPKYILNNRDKYNGLSVLPADGGTYKQAPFEDCSRERHEVLSRSLSKVDLTKIIETDDNTDLQGELACAGGSCSISYL